MVWAEFWSCGNNWPVITSDKVSLLSTERYESEFWVSISVVELQPLEKVEQQFLFFQGCSPVKHPGVILKQPAMVVNIEEIFSHPRSRFLALCVIAPFSYFRKASCGAPLCFQGPPPASSYALRSKFIDQKRKLWKGCPSPEHLS